ncbi:L,D-transpeptidase family protein [Brevibacterium sp. 5221]|uniref:L,D-transpeptidase family protein n=1 Tax=Brevibacterium rongguiense TaxID=2695267 RepID=A0A6N9H8W2_9MICO|nr:L,D-transpeptidase family protein [Brevibacterium rongguiense]MYM19942.1 L,D-transpeptidase family protein [Brevibacterium rongguiense]
MTSRNRPRTLGIAGATALTAALVGSAVSPASAAPSGDDALDAPAITSPSDFAGPTLRTPAAAAPKPHADPTTAAAKDSGQSTMSGSSQDSSGTAQATAIPGVGKKNMAKLPAGTTQVLVATTKQQKGTTARTTLYTLQDGTWKKERSFAGHNGKNGWKANRREGDQTSPAGVFSLTAAGGYDKNPGTKLPYTRDASMRSGAEAQYGAKATGVFDYVIAIDFNRKPGTPPRDGTQPLGPKPGSGIWLHVDHGSGTHGCVTLAKNDLKYLLQTLTPAAKPHIIMGSAADIGK